jgi:hypothetical protein
VAVVCLVFVVLVAEAEELTRPRPLQVLAAGSPVAVQAAVDHPLRAVLQQQVEQVGAVSSS